MKEKGSVEMNDIEKKLEDLKAEFLGKLEALEKEAEMQKKQEEPKPWKPKDGEDYFYIGIDFTIDSWENVDDERPIRSLMKEILDDEGHVTDVAEDGEVGLQMAEKERYDVIFCDIKMPNLSGEEVLGRLKDKGID